MRVIAGELKGRKLYVPHGISFRPTSDRVKEAIFSSIESMTSLEGAFVLDLFSGSGAMGIEALSRGSRCVFFVEKDTKLISSIEKHLLDFGVADRGRVFCSNVEDCLGLIKKELRVLGEKKGFDVVFADPPYGTFQAKILADFLLQPGFVREGALFVMESENGSVEGEGKSVTTSLKNFSLHKCKVYGGTRVRYFIFQKERG